MKDGFYWKLSSIVLAIVATSQSIWIVLNHKTCGHEDLTQTRRLIQFSSQTEDFPPRLKRRNKMLRKDIAQRDNVYSLCSGYKKENMSSAILDFSSYLGPIPNSSIEMPFPFDEKKVVYYIRQKLCPKRFTECSGDVQTSLLSPFANTMHGDIKILLDNNKTITLDDVAWAYTKAAEAFVTFSFTNFLGVPMQQGPKDAFAIMDLIWRLKPDLILEFGTAGGGSGFRVYYDSICFFA